MPGQDSGSLLRTGRLTVLRATSALGTVQVFAWGSTYYLLAVLSGPIRAETGWSGTLVTAGISLGLLIAGLSSAFTGRMIHRHGGRRVMATAMGLLAAGLSLLALAPTPGVYLAAWAVLGLGMGAGLYDAAFSALGQVYGTNARRAITQLTLWGGFASTVCWPLSALLVEVAGWRGACAAYAVLHLTVSLPLCLTALPRALPRAPEIVRVKPGARMPVDPVFWLLATEGMVLSLISSIVSVHLIVLLQARDVPLAAAVALGTLIGPAQVAARVADMATGARYPAIWTLLSATALVAAGVVGMQAGLPMAAALVIYGAGNGIWSIARGAVPLALYGADRYPLVMGRLARPALLASAVAPSLGAVSIDRLGADATFAVLAVLSAVPVICAALLVQITRRSRQEVAPPA